MYKIKALFYFIFLGLNFSCTNKTEIDTSKFTNSKNPIQLYQDSIGKLPFFENEEVYSFLNKIGTYNHSRAIYSEQISSKTLAMLVFRDSASLNKDSPELINGILREFEFDFRDKNFIKKQIDAFNGKKWDLKKLEAKTELQIRPFKDSITWYLLNRKELPDKNITYCYNTLGMPLFNKKKDKVIQFYSYQCKGTLGSADIYLYQLRNGIWVQAAKFNMWIS